MTLPDPARSRTVLVGTRSYTVDSGLSELPGVTGNVVDFSRLLTELTGLPADHCRTLLDRTDDREVCQEVRKAAKEAEDLLLVYFAGHGLIDPESSELFLALSHSDPDEPLYTAVRFTEVREAMSASRARNRVLILDCCFSGRAIVDAMGPDAEAIALAQTETRGAYTLTATSANLPALARPGARHTAFTGALLELLRDGIPGAGPYLTLADLFTELRRTLDPQPRQQGTDNAGRLALAPNPRYRPSSTETAEPSVAGPTTQAPWTPTAITFPTNRRRARRDRLLITARFLPLLPALAVAKAFGLLGSSSWWFFGPVLVLALAENMARRRVPRTYELRVDGDGLRLDISPRLTGSRDSFVVQWHDVERVTTLRSRPTVATPDQLVIWMRRGFVPPQPHPFGPRPHRERAALIFCDLPRLRAEVADVELAVAEYAGGLWDSTHDLAEAESARFVKSRADTVLVLVWACAVAALASIGLVGVGQPVNRWPGAFLVAVGWLWLVGLGMLALRLLGLALLPQRLVLDDRRLRIQHGRHRLSLSWEEIVDVSLAQPGKHGEVLLITVRPQSASRTRAFAVKGSPSPERLRFLLGNVGVTRREIEVALGRFAGERWADGQGTRVPAPRRDPNSAMFTGRILGLRSKMIGAVNMGAAGACLLLLFVKSAWFTVPLPIGVGAVLLGRLMMWAREPVELRLDREALELTAGALRIRVTWADVSRVGMATTTRGLVETQSLVIWLKEGAPVPGKWSWRHCFTPYSGGLQVVNVSRVDGLRVDPQELAGAVAHFAGPAWQNGHRSSRPEATPGTAI